MKYYNFDAETKRFTIEGIADESPLELGVYLLPANATFQEPPRTSSNETAVWDGSSWSVELIIDPTDPALEIKTLTWDDIRANRNVLLDRSDWTQLPDVALSAAAVASWQTYRKSLRAIMSAFEAPESVVWPTAP